MKINAVVLVPPIVGHTSATADWEEIFGKKQIATRRVDLFVDQPVCTGFPFPANLLFPVRKREAKMGHFAGCLSLATIIANINSAVLAADPDPALVLLMGWSIGAAAALKYAQDNEVAGVVGISPLLYPPAGWELNPNQVVRPILLIGGSNDTQIPVMANSIRSWQSHKPGLVEPFIVEADHAFDTTELRFWLRYNPMYDRTATQQCKSTVLSWLERV